MAQDIYNARGSVAGVFKGTLAAITLGGSTAAKGSLVQSIQVSYQRQVNRIWELGSEDTYFILGHTQGSASLSKIVGRNDSDIIREMQDACESINQVLTISSTGGSAGGQCLDANLDFQLIIGGPILQNVSFGFNASNFVVTNEASIQFASLSRN